MTIGEALSIVGRVVSSPSLISGISRSRRSDVIRDGFCYEGRFHCEMVTWCAF